MTKNKKKQTKKSVTKKVVKKIKKILKKPRKISVKSKPKKKAVVKLNKKIVVKAKKFKKQVRSKVKKVKPKAKPKKIAKVVRKKIKPKKVVKKKIKSVKKPKAEKVIKTSKPIKRVASKPAQTIKVDPVNLLDFSTNNLFKAKIKVIGIGGGGSSIVSEIGKSLGKATFTIADTDSRFVKKQKGIKYLLFGQELTHGLGTGLNPELARSAAENEKEKISELFENQDIVILVASLGGGVGSGATKVFADISKKYNCITFGIFTLPFKFEGKNKHKIALKSLAELRRLLNVSITIPNERIFRVIDADTSITQAFSMINKNLIRSLESLIDLIYSPGVINIDFADLKAILQGKGNLAFLNTAEASGKDSSEKIIEEILNNPLYQNNNFTAEKILFNIAGGNNLSMMEVDKISRMISSQNQKAKIIFGISKSSEYKNKIKTTVLMTGSPTGKEAKVSEVKEPIKKEIEKKSIVKKTVQKKKVQASKVIKEKEISILDDNLMPVFTNVPISTESAKLSVIDAPSQKKAIRRSALEIKKDQEIQENKKSQQEKEWEIPAFLRFKK